MVRKLFRSLNIAKRRYTGLPNVIGVGIGYKKKGQRETDELAVIFFVEKKLPAEALRIDQLVPRRIAGVPTDVVEIGEVRFLGRTGKVRPAPPGVSIGHYRVTAGTFGAVVKDRKTGEIMILSNNHILANTTDGNDGRAQIGDPVYQPGSYDGGSDDDVIGNLAGFIPVYRYTGDAECKVATFGLRAANTVIQAFRPNYYLRLEKRGRVNLVDCAVARPLEPDLITPEILEIGRVAGIREPEPGLVVKKSGRTSGLTIGKITAIRVVLNVTMGMGNDAARFQEQVVADLKSAPGDSGSLVLDEENRAVGLLFAGSTDYSVFNPIQTVLEKLGVDLV
ncbi:MAG: Uncharacterized protein XD63_0466 [Thermoanaerobacterales bacterium 50_218]|nr:MAG: Uncharacterized protein XD63_0466 [Thermoanaerobacterales bacterium 50_218]HAA89753.1 hypothetical protein [Peptococcaceae bacterium]